MPFSVFSYGRYLSGDFSGCLRLTISTLPFSGSTIFSVMCPTISSKSRMTGVMYVSARLKARIVCSNISWADAALSAMTP